MEIQSDRDALTKLRGRWKKSSSYRGLNRRAIWLRDRGLNLTTGVKVSLGAVGLTVLGDTVFGFLANIPAPLAEWLPWNWNWTGRGIWHAVLMLIVFFGACWKFEDFIQIFYRPKGDSEGRTEAKDLEKIETPDALIVFVSVPGKDRETGKIREAAYEASVRRLILDKQDKLPVKHRHVYLVHSDETVAIAREYSQRTNIKQNAYLTIHLPHLMADFTSTASCHEVCKNAVQRARMQSGVENVVIDITGGTKPASSAAVLAGLDMDVGLCYIEQTPGNPIKGVDVEWRRASSS